MLLRRKQLLESGVQMREQTLHGLIKMREVTAKVQPRLPPQPQQQPDEGCSSGSAGAAQRGTGAPGAGATQRHPLHSWTSHQHFPDPEVDEWDAALCAAVRQMSARDIQNLWVDFVQESSMLAFSVHVHGPESDVSARLTRVVSHSFRVSHRIQALNQVEHSRCMYVNVLTGAPQVPDLDYWRKCAKSVPLTAEQLEFCKSLMGEHARRMGSLLDERSLLTKQLESLVLGSHTGLPVLAAKLESNVARECASHSFVEDFLTRGPMKVLTPVQIALFCAAAFPLIPDATAIAAVAVELGLLS
ncbi:hypothetical protein FOA52_005746 [Chlamydomonas sp. UWO 241]|nr:hypothetical protein FOA52_005746 [Chlamydomonas sp. UWO 241]